jgi:hypothetical protein
MPRPSSQTPSLLSLLKPAESTPVIIIITNIVIQIAFPRLLRPLLMPISMRLCPTVIIIIVILSHRISITVLIIVRFCVITAALVFDFGFGTACWEANGWKRHVDPLQLNLADAADFPTSRFDLRHEFLGCEAIFERDAALCVVKVEIGIFPDVLPMLVQCTWR